MASHQNQNRTALTTPDPLNADGKAVDLLIKLHDRPVARLGWRIGPRASIGPANVLELCPVPQVRAGTPGVEPSGPADNDAADESEALSVNLPARAISRGPGVAAFFENLLPEGGAFGDLLTLTARSRRDIPGLLAALPDDLTGAVSVDAPGRAAVSGSQSLRPLSDEELLLRLRHPEAHPMGLWDGCWRLALAGVQTKLGVVRLPEDAADIVDNADGCGNVGRAEPSSRPGRPRWALPAVTVGAEARTTHILKFSPSDISTLALNEFLTMRLARRAGLDAASISLRRRCVGRRRRRPHSGGGAL